MNKKPLIICNECPYFTVLGFKFYCEKYGQYINTATRESLNSYFLYHAINDCIMNHKQFIELRIDWIEENNPTNKDCLAVLKEWLREIEQE